jgi:sulfite reductase alpha subunit-like flavoprotein
MTHLADIVVRPQAKTQNRTALILYGSETGNSQDVAEEVGRLAERLRFDTTVLDCDSVQLRDVVKYSMVVFALSTAGQGEMPQNARAFWKMLLSGALKPGVLRRLRFTSFGLGDSSYPRYNVAHRMLCGRLTQLGATSFCERGEGNEQHPEGHSAGFREWIVQLKNRMLESFPLPEGVSAMEDDEFIEPRWKLSLEVVTREPTNGVTQDFKIESDTEQGGESLAASSTPSNDEAPPSIQPVPVKDSYTASLVANDRVTSADHFQDVRLLDLRLDRSYSYYPGAVAVVYPKNFPVDVNEFIKLMHWEDVADKPMNVISTRANITAEASRSRLDRSHPAMAAGERH